jgi:eukaryotic-like serine/threonine-protein kinase
MTRRRLQEQKGEKTASAFEYRIRLEKSTTMLAPGTRLGPYEVVTLIGSGGMGEVYRARDARLGRDVAVKVIRGAESRDTERLERFEQEARAAGLLNHPNVLAIYDIGTHEGAPYLVSELLEGETIRLRLITGPLQPSKVLGFATQIAEGLAAAHEKGIVHRDLKPENLFVTKDGRVKILDFGLAKLVQTNGAFGVDSQAATADTSGPTVGTVSYMSPEQIRGQPVDHRSDIFSFGVVLYEMLTGRRAFLGASPVETMNAALKEDPPDLSELPAGMDLIVEHCVEKDPANRFQSAPDLAFHLKALSTASVTGKRAPFVGRPRRAPLVTRERVLALAAVAVLVGGAFLAGGRLAHVAPPSFHQLTFRRGMIFSARFAPDGDTVVYGASWDGQPFQVFSTRPESPESRSLGLPPGDVLAVSGSGELALCLERRTVLGWESRGTLARVGISGGAPREILTDVESADWSPDGDRLAVIHVVDGRYRLEFPIGKTLYESAGWLSNVRISPFGTRLAFEEHPLRSDDRGDVCVIDADGRNMRALSTGWASANGAAWATETKIWFTASPIGGRTSLLETDLQGRHRLLSETPGRLAILDVRNDRALLTESRFRLRVAVRGTGDGSGTERDMSWLDGSVGADLSDDGRLLLISEQSAESGAGSYATYLRATDGSPAVRLGTGLAQSLSPDGTLAASLGLSGRASISLLPTGPGAERTITPTGIAHIGSVAWFPDSRRLAFSGNAPGDAPRLYVQGLGDKGPRPISGPGLRFPFPCKAVSPDGSSIAAVDQEGRAVIEPVAGGEPRPVAGTRPGDIPIRWSGDGRSLYLFRRDELPARLLRADLVRGDSSVIAEIAPADWAGVRPLIAIQLTPDGRFCAFSYSQTLSNLYVAGGLR